jgi:hypothetical protein
MLNVRVALMATTSGWFRSFVVPLLGFILVVFLLGFLVHQPSLTWKLVGLNAFWICMSAVLLSMAFSSDVVERSMKKTVWGKRLSIITRVFLVVIVLLTLIFLGIPIIKDTSWMIDKGMSWAQVPQEEGIVQGWSGGLPDSRFLYQNIWFEDGVTYRIYLAGEPFMKGHAYQIRYLPTTKIIIAYRELPVNAS